jgi:hypothetical protein
VIFHSYVSLPEGKKNNNVWSWCARNIKLPSSKGTHISHIHHSLFSTYIYIQLYNIYIHSIYVHTHTENPCLPPFNGVFPHHWSFLYISTVTGIWEARIAVVVARLRGALVVSCWLLNAAVAQVYNSWIWFDWDFAKLIWTTYSCFAMLVIFNYCHVVSMFTRMPVGSQIHTASGVAKRRQGTPWAEATVRSWQRVSTTQAFVKQSKFWEDLMSKQRLANCWILNEA